MIELLVVLAIMGIVLGVSGLALASLKAPRESEAVRHLREIRSQAIRTGLAVPFRAPRSAVRILFLPDGRAIGADVDPLTGALRDSTR